MLFARQQQSFTGHTIDALQDFADRLGFWPKLVFDRGFGNESIVEHLHAAGATFYIRVKAGDYVTSSTELTVSTKIATLTEKDSTIQLYGLTLRVVRSPKSRRAPEPWYILTNDFASSRNKVVKIYYHRFEIEETFKDTKHLFELKRLKFNRPTSLKVVLWLVFLGVALLYVVAKPTKQQTTDVNPRKRCSWVRLAYEQFQQVLTTYRNLTGLTPRSERGLA
jgi:IS4 transposase